MLYKPKEFKYKKLQKKRIKGFYKTLTHKNVDVVFGKYGLRSLEKGEVTPNQIEAVRKVLSKEIKKSGKIWIRIFPNVIRTAKPAEVRMGKGKGVLDHWSCPIKCGQVLFEISNINIKIAILILKKAADKLPVLTKLIIKQS